VAQTLPIINAAGITDPIVAAAVQTIKEHIDLGDGSVGTGNEQVIRVKDIIGDSDLRFKIPGNPSATLGEVIETGLSSSNYSLPPTITNLTANGTFAAVYLDWTIGVDGSYAYTEIWRATVDDILQAVKVGTAIVGVYADYVASASTHYYWARAVNPAGVTGAYNKVAGTLGETVEDPAFLIGQISGEILATDLHADLQARMDNLDAQYVVKVGSNGRMAGFGIAAEGVDSAFTFEVLADRFAIVHPNGGATVPFVVSGGNTYIDTAVIADASITSAKIGTIAADKIAAGTISAALTMTAANIVGGTLNVGPIYVDKNRMVVGEANKDGTGLVITERYIQVWEAGVKRVEIGLLT